MPQSLTPLPPGTIVPVSEEQLKAGPPFMTLSSKPSAEDFAADFDTYIAIQKTIDERMKDSVMDIQGKKFRKKAYWRAVATAFNVTVEPHMDEYFEIGSQSKGDLADWGYRVTYKAWTPSGRVAYGDGTVMRSEKLVYDYEWVNGRRGKRLGVNWDKTDENATHHNIRGHAHTRAINRAVSNLVGFGEVSAEEMPMDRLSKAPGRAAGTASRPPQASSGPWDGNLPVTFGKYKPGAKEGGPNGKKWSELSTGYLDWILGPKCSIDTAKDMAAKELGRRAKAESKSDVVDAEVLLPLPLDPSPDVEDPRLYDDDDGYQP